MTRWSVGVWVLALVACGGKDGDTGPLVTTDDGGGACGELSEWTIDVTARVVDGDSNQPVEGADVRLIEESWTLGGDFGGGTTDAQGMVTFSAVDVISVEDCWGTALDYKLTALRGEKVGEKDMNPSLFGAITDGDLVTDVSDFPVTLF